MPSQPSNCVRLLGESTFSGEAFRTCPVEAARALHPLVCKSLLNAEAPLQWKGAQLAALFKGKGSRAHLTSYRDVALGDPDAKLYGKLLRKFLLKSVKAIDPVMQFGSGCGGGGCDLPHLAARALLQLGEVRCCCAALLFLDVTTVFASMVRETALPTDAGKEAWMLFLVQRGYPSDFAAEVMQAVARICDWEETGFHSMLWLFCRISIQKLGFLLNCCPMFGGARLAIQWPTWFT